jgi:hypothetical protein
MEDVLDVYEHPYDKDKPVVCMDEKPYQLLGEVRDPIPMTPSHDQLIDNEYVRQGTCSIFMFNQPLKGWRRADASQQRTRSDWAREVQQLVDVDFPEASTIILVMDNLNTHTIGSLYETFSAEQAHRIAGRLEIHYTPKHGSWLNMAEIELSCLSKQCLERRIGDIDTLNQELTAWQNDVNADQRQIVWQFTTDDARIKLRHLYPTV